MEGYDFPTIITPGDFLKLYLLCHYAGLVDYEGYTCKFNTFSIDVYDASTFLGTIKSGPLPRQGDWTSSLLAYAPSGTIEYYYVQGVLGNKIPFAWDYVTAASQAYYGWDYWSPLAIPSWIKMPARGAQPQQKVYTLSFGVEWEIYYNGGKLYTARQTSDITWPVTLMPPPSYPGMVIDDANSYFPMQIAHDEPFSSTVKIVAKNSDQNAEGRAYLDQIYKGKITQLLVQAVQGVASFEYSLAGKTIENILGQTFTKDTPISSAELKFVTGYINDSGQKQQTNEWLRGINVTVSNGTPPPPPDSEKSLWETIKVPAMVGAGIVGLLLLFERKR